MMKNMERRILISQQSRQLIKRILKLEFRVQINNKESRVIKQVVREVKRNLFSQKRMQRRRR
jgi:hypothetical protein